MRTNSCCTTTGGIKLPPLNSFFSLKVLDSEASTLRKTNIDPKHNGLEEELPFKPSDFLVSMFVLGGVSCIMPDVPVSLCCLLPGWAERFFDWNSPPWEW